MTRLLLTSTITAILTLSPSGPAVAELATAEEAALVAANWTTYAATAYGAWDGRVPTVTHSREIAASDTLLGWCFFVSPSGHLVVPSIKELPPVKSYSDTYGMTLSDPDGYAKLIEEVLLGRVRTVAGEYGSLEAAVPLDGGENLGASHREQWDRFGVPPDEFAAWLASRGREPLSQVGPLLETAWHQGAPYNNLCPMGDGGRTMVGCVATAAAQILRYHAEPLAGYGSHCYYWGGDHSCGGSTPGGTLCAGFEDPYDWENMPNSCSSGCTAEERAALAELSYEVAAAFDMDFGRCGSGTLPHLALDIFPVCFSYSDAIDKEDRADHYLNSWFSVIQEEINLGRPLQYTISYHTIVCDGWLDDGETKQYHMNYGWADPHTAWYVLDELYGSPDPMAESLIRRIIPPDSAWEDVADGPPVGDPGDGMGAAWADYDGDGDIDLYFTNDGTGNVLARNDGTPGFADATVGPLGDAGSGAAAVWGDYDNDGDPDLYVVNTGGANVLARNDGGGAFTDVTSGPLGDGGNGYGAAWADYDLDGDLDIYVANSGGANRLLRNDGGGAFTNVTSGPVGDTGAGRGVAWSDYDLDGDPDLYVANYGAANRLLRNDGGGTFVDGTSGPLGDAGNGTGVAWGDYDDDGDPDLYVANYGGPNLLLRNEGGGVFVDGTSGPLGDAGNGTGVAWGDYDLDGDLDLYVVNDGGPNRLLRNLGDGFADVASPPIDDQGEGQGAAWGDFNHDGHLDLAIMKRNGANVLLRCPVTSSANYLFATLEGLISNRSAIGARTRVVAGGRSQVREVSGGSGYLSQDSTTAEFGLGWSVVVDTLQIFWPSGEVNTYTGLPAGQFAHFVEIPAPSAPTGLTATPVEVGVVLTWSPVGDEQLAFYRVERDTSAAFGPGTVTATTTDTIYVDFPIMEIREYFYRVVAAGTGGNYSDPSNVVTASPIQTPPNRPENVVAVPGDALVDVTWRRVGSPDLDHYRVERGRSPTFEGLTHSFTTFDESFTDGPLDDGEYFYRVFSVDWGGFESAPSETVSAVPLVLPPSVPTGLTAESGDGVVSLEWNHNPELDISRYAVYRDTARAAGDSLASVLFRRYDDESADNFRVYCYSVEAIDDHGLRSARSETIACVATPAGAVFVDCQHSGYENGTHSYPYSDLASAISQADSGAAVLVLPCDCMGSFTIDESVFVLGVHGPSATSITSVCGSVITATAGSEPAELHGVTLDGLQSAQNALECAGANLRVADCTLTGANVGAAVHSGAAPILERNEFTGNYYGVACSDSSRPALYGNRFHANTFAHVSNSGEPGPVIGGSLPNANDFLDQTFLSIFNTGTTPVVAEYNYWGDACVDSTWFHGPVDFVPWTDSLHVEVYYVCTGVGVDEDLPVRYALGRSFPNPFNATTRMAYDVPWPGGRVTLGVYNAAGALVAELLDRVCEPGRHVVTWDGKDSRGIAVASGVYFYRMEAEGFTARRKTVLLK